MQSGQHSSFLGRRNVFLFEGWIRCHFYGFVENEHNTLNLGSHIFSLSKEASSMNSLGGVHAQSNYFVFWRDGFDNMFGHGSKRWLSTMTLCHFVATSATKLSFEQRR
jgi:hypothetical protein